MTLEQFKEKSLDLVIQFLCMTLEAIKDKKIEPLTKQKLVGTALSLILYVQDELTSICNDSEKSISD